MWKVRLPFLARTHSFDERFLTMAKVSSRFEFPTVLDVSEFLEHQRMPEADRLDPERHVYILHTVGEIPFDGFQSHV